MKRTMMMVLVCCMLLVSAFAAADGYENGDNWEKTFTGTGGIATAEVISKSVTLREAFHVGEKCGQHSFGGLSDGVGSG